MNLLSLPILIPLVGAAVSLLFWNSRAAQRVIALFVGVCALFISIVIFRETSTGQVLALPMGNWPAPYGIILVADHLSAIMLMMGSLASLAGIIYSIAVIDSRREAYGYYPLVLVLLMGVSGSFLTGDIFNLYVWFEVMLMSSFVLLALGGERGQIEGAIKYVTLNLMASLLFLAATGILYGLAGTLNFADLAVKLGQVEETGLVSLIAVLYLVAFGVKAGVFPLYSWLPASYHTPPVAVTAIFAALLTKVGVYVLIRVFTLIFVNDLNYTHNILLVVAGLTMVLGVLGAYAQYEVRRLLSFHIISQIGYMVFGLAVSTPVALSGAIMHIANNMLAKTNLFFLSGIIRAECGSFDLRHCGGLFKRKPLLSVLFLISALSLAGIPPLAGFFSKALLIQGGMESGVYFATFAAVATSLVTLMSMVKIWMEAFWKEQPESAVKSTESFPRAGILMYTPAVVLAALICLGGIYMEDVVQACDLAARQLIRPEAYIEAVLGGQR